MLRLTYALLTLTLVSGVGVKPVHCRSVLSGRAATLVADGPTLAPPPIPLAQPLPILIADGPAPAPGPIPLPA